MTSLFILHHKKPARRFPVLLSLFAIMAIYVVPLISQLNMQAHGMSGMHMDAMMMHHHIVTQQASQPSPKPPPASNTASPHSYAMSKMLNEGAHDHAMDTSHGVDMVMIKHLHDSSNANNDNDSLGLKAACGFCTLLFHLYWLAALTFILPIVKPQPYPVVHHWVRSHILRILYSQTLPRAPPTPFSFVF